MTSTNTNTVKALVAVDFGTTYSGLCWALAEKPGDNHAIQHNLIQQWPGEAAGYNKVPSTLLYDNEGTHIWGYQIKDTVPRHEWFKLGLFPGAEDSNLAQRYPSLSALQKVHGEDAEKLVIDYLTSLRKHAESTMETTYGRALFSKISREYIITVPAVWSDIAQDKTRRCAQKAGMGDYVQIITEPEAAGIYALDSTPNVDLKINDTFVLCDAGGGTVDLVSYTIAALKPIPKLVESAEGSGGLCGSIFLNRIFSSHLKEKFKNYPDWTEEYHGDALKAFDDDIKKNFMGDTRTPYIINVRPLRKPELGIVNGKLKISGQEVKEIFEPVIQEILALVKGQITNTRKPVKAVLMAGGFGLSEYLRKRIQGAISTDIDVRKVAQGETAIVKGALIRGLSEKEPGLATIRVESRIARRHYGTMAYDIFGEGHEEGRKEPGPFGDRIKVMQWLIAKNTNISETLPNKPTLYWWDRPVLDGPPTIITVAIYACDRDQQPEYPDASKYSKLPLLGVRMSADFKRARCLQACQP
ncbi:uncharacterized protein LY89DRAFT_241035 [Mollisia scopiformis]|uniref:Actin-like ATPase domain-containing protein n=1 Tax=Mollisia scopiformis TaxID=149040 RepID=A0A194WUJ0_MOLSC|nr:uncharacterized protein LY89DRAFT_241035 [Mollisia scopiformis]KUJ11277.1 hypothetical protein LY89DRAFT_241035 [Mollisia scopiformis]